MRYDYQKLKDFGTKVMISAGLEKEEAVLFMENLLYADSRGVGSHGISRLINYAKRVKCGIITPGANVEVLQESAATLVAISRSKGSFRWAGTARLNGLVPSMAFAPPVGATAMELTLSTQAIIPCSAAYLE